MKGEKEEEGVNDVSRRQRNNLDSKRQGITTCQTREDETLSSRSSKIDIFLTYEIAKSLFRRISSHFFFFFFFFWRKRISKYRNISLTLTLKTDTGE